MSDDAPRRVAVLVVVEPEADETPDGAAERLLAGKAGRAFFVAVEADLGDPNRTLEEVTAHWRRDSRALRGRR